MATLAERRNSAMQVPNEIEPFTAEIVRREPKVIVEIGTASGGTLARWLEIPSAELVISIDLPNGVHGGQSFDDRIELKALCHEYAASRGIIFHAIDGNSNSAVVSTALFRALLNRKIDFLFIDADHSYGGVKYDYLRYKKDVRKGGVIALHDIIDSAWQNSIGADGPHKLWQEIKAERETLEFIDSKQAVNIWPHTAPDGFGGIGMIVV
jgi:predicted O-methyltransferase YrrM